MIKRICRHLGLTATLLLPAGMDGFWLDLFFCLFFFPIWLSLQAVMEFDPVLQFMDNRSRFQLQNMFHAREQLFQEPVSLFLLKARQYSRRLNPRSRIRLFSPHFKNNIPSIFPKVTNLAEPGHISHIRYIKVFKLYLFLFRI